ncbi:MAG: LysR substrate-binding domain-containing protein [Pseudomonadota bacterium]
MTGPIPPLSALRAFQLAAQWENFAKAADHLCVSQSAVSQRIRTLEEFLQVKLFLRLGNRVALTEEGRRLGARLSEAFEIIEEACAQSTHGRFGGRVHVSAEAAFATRWLRPRLGEFHKRHADLQVNLNAIAELSAANADSSDIVIHFEKRLNSNTHEIERVFPIDGYPACSPEFLRGNPGISAPIDISRLPLIHDNSRMIWRRWFDRFVPESDAWRSGYVYSDLSLAIDAATDGEGVILADDLLCAREMASAGLVRVLPQTVRCAWYCVAIRHPKTAGKAVLAFRQWLKDSVTRKADVTS